MNASFIRILTLVFVFTLLSEFLPTSATARPAESASLAAKKKKKKKKRAKPKRSKNKRSKKRNKKRRKGGKRKKAAKRKLPAMKSPTDKLKVLNYFRKMMPSQREYLGREFGAAMLDGMLERRLQKAEVEPVRVVDDQTFARRVYLDLVGRKPNRTEIGEFAADSRTNKRSQLIEALLQSPGFSQRWGQYWSTVMLSRANANRRRYDRNTLTNWLTTQFKNKQSWDKIAAQLLSASGKDKKVGPDNFSLALSNRPKDLAAETARIFMGIQIQCAECHDHPFDRWKRVQFHQMAAFFARGKYKMPDMDMPSKKTTVAPRFLLGEDPGSGLNADHRRVAVAAFMIYNPKNYWFARAYVNRVWTELVGDGFYAVDSLGPDQEVMHKLVVNRLAYVFRYKRFDTRWVFRTILNSKAYQRESRYLSDPKKFFSATRPSRLRNDQIAKSLNQVIGNKLDRQVRSAFAVDLSIPQSELAGSIQQALLLMNNPILNRQIRQGPLTQRLLKMNDHSAVAAELYLSVLARRPTMKERERVTQLIRQAGKRPAIEDMIWVLINSAEFLTKR